VYRCCIGSQQRSACAGPVLHKLVASFKAHIREVSCLKEAEALLLVKAEGGVLAEFCAT
jgi:hypothetical protein